MKMGRTMLRMDKYSCSQSHCSQSARAQTSPTFLQLHLHHPLSPQGLNCVQVFG